MTLKIRPTAIEQDHGPFYFPGIGIGTDTPEYLFHLYDPDNADPYVRHVIEKDDGIPEYRAIGFHAGGIGTRYSGYAARGSKASPAVLEDDDLIVDLTGYGWGDYGASKYKAAGWLKIYADENWVSGSAYASRLDFAAIPQGEASVRRLLSIGSLVEINPSKYDIDTVIRGDSEDNLLYIDAGNDRVGILTAAPTTPLTIGPDPLAPLNANEMLQLAKTNDVYMTIRDGTAVFLQGSTSGLPFMGTQSNHDITFRTNNTEKVRIKNTGEVGINTTSPDHLLHIVDDAIGLMMERTGATTNLVRSAAIYKYTTSGDMQDGHGAGLLFAIEDDAAVNNYIAGLQAIRNGADDTGMLRVIVREGGVERNVVDFKHNEVVFNEDSRDVNYRFEGDGEDNLLYIDGGYDSIGIGINSLNSTGRKVIAVAGGTAPGASLTDAAQLWVEDVAAGIADFKMRTENNIVGRILNVSTTVYHNTTQSIPNNTWTNLAFNSEISDDEGWHDPTTNNDRITPLEAGEYMFFLENCNFESNSTGQREAQIFSSTHGNLNFFTVNAIGGGKATFLPVFAHRYISGGYIVCQVRQNSGGALNILSSPKFTAIKIK